MGKPLPKIQNYNIYILFVKPQKKGKSNSFQKRETIYSPYFTVHTTDSWVKDSLPFYILFTIDGNTSFVTEGFWDTFQWHHIVLIDLACR